MTMLSESLIESVLWFFQSSGFLFELILSIGLYTWKLDRRPPIFFRMGLSLTLMLIICLVWAELVHQNPYTLILRVTVFYAMCLAAMKICLCLSTGQAVFYLVAGVATQHLIYCGAQIIVSLLKSFTDMRGDMLSYLVYPVIFLALLPVVYRVFARSIVEHAPPSTVSKHIPLILVGVMLCVNVFACLFDELVGNTRIPVLAYLMFTLTRLITCIFILVLLDEISGRRAAEQDGLMLQRLLAQQEQQMQHDKETVDLINIKAHDIKKEINDLGTALDKDEIKDLNTLIDVYDTKVKAGNEALEILLAGKALLCQKRGIQFDRMIDGSCLDFMRQGDVYSLFANAMDNAIEATDSLNVMTDKYIRLIVHPDKGMAVIHLENPYKGRLIFKDDLPVTTKSDARYHGFGMRSMRMIVTRYKGYMVVDDSQGIFRLNILLPVP